MEGLYPLKFTPIFKDYIWGGSKLKTIFNKPIPESFERCSESWEVSSVADNVSVVSNGYLAGNSLDELIEVYMGDLVGDKIYTRFGQEFPLLVKFIDAADTLSIQVHPNDEQAKREHHAYGKTEMWYVLDCDRDAEIITGFREQVSRELYLNRLSQGRLKDILNVEIAHPDDVFFIPAGRVHAIGRGNLIVEIQQTSDITYRIFDWNRVDKNGMTRELHTDLALKVIDFSRVTDPKRQIPLELNKTSELVDCPYFTTNRLAFNQPIGRDYQMLDSFIIYICLEGALDVVYRQGKGEHIVKGETVLIPAELKNIILKPLPQAKILEVFVR